MGGEKIGGGGDFVFCYKCACRMMSVFQSLF